MALSYDDTAADKRSARDRILAAANQLFYDQGIRAIGIDTVIEVAGVAKMSLYRAFPSKDDLIAAFLENRTRMYWDWWEGIMARHPGQPRRQIVAVFTALSKLVVNPKYRGCPFINAAVEFPDPTHPGRLVAEAHKRELRRRLCELTQAAGAPHPALTADHLFILMEGAYASGGVLRPDGPAASVASAAEALLAYHLGPEE